MDLFYALFIFTWGHTDVFFEYAGERGHGIETQFVGDFRKRNVFANEFFCLVDFKFKIGLINGHTRLFAEEYEIDVETAKRDAHAFLQAFRNRGMLEE